MRLPREDKDKLELYTEVIAACGASRQRRIDQYAQNRRWYIFGSDDGSVSAWNKCYSHLDLVTSFLYASDSTRFAVRMGTNAPKADMTKTGAFGKKITEEWVESNADSIYSQGTLWGLVYDSAFVKHIRTRGSIQPFLVDPGSFGVYREDVAMLDRQEAFVHWWYQTESDLEGRLRYHPRRADILSKVHGALSKRDIGSSVPPMIDRIINPTFSPRAAGEANLDLDLPQEYAAEITVPLVEMAELWIWNDDEDDYQTVTMASKDVIVYDRKNLFLPRMKNFEAEHPFVQICPNPLYDYFWGLAELQRLIPLQKEYNDAQDNLKRMYEKQVDPSNMFSGMGLVEEKMHAFNNPGSYVAGEPGATLHSQKTDVPASSQERIKMIEAQFEETSGITASLAGRGDKGVRSDRHAQALLTAGSSRPKKRAVTIEDSLAKGATLYGKVIFCDDDTPLYDDNNQKFVPAQIDPHFFVEVDSHSNSPIFLEDQREKAELLFKAKAINRKRLIQMVNPPMQDEIIQDLETKIIPEEAAQMKARNEAVAAGQAGKPGGKLSSVK